MIANRKKATIFLKFILEGFNRFDRNAYSCFWVETWKNFFWMELNASSKDNERNCRNNRNFHATIKHAKKEQTKQFGKHPRNIGADLNTPLIEFYKKETRINCARRSMISVLLLLLILLHFRIGRTCISIISLTHEFYTKINKLRHRLLPSSLSMAF